MSSDVTALILAGGKATRFGGIAKHRIEIEGQTIFDRQVTILRPRVAEILVSAPDDIPGFRCVRDVTAGVGPLAGIAAGLGACATPWLLVVAGDMPYLTGALIDRMIAARDGDAVGIRVNGLPEPLVCVLHVRTLPIVERRIAARQLKASGLLTGEGLMVRWIDDADSVALRNVNSPEDL